MLQVFFQNWLSWMARKWQHVRLFTSDLSHHVALSLASKRSKRVRILCDDSPPHASPLCFCSHYFFSIFPPSTHSLHSAPLTHVVCCLGISVKQEWGSRIIASYTGVREAYWSIIIFSSSLFFLPYFPLLADACCFLPRGCCGTCLLENRPICMNIRGSGAFLLWVCFYLRVSYCVSSAPLRCRLLSASWLLWNTRPGI